MIFVKRIAGPYLVFLASTINGYEGTGRSLSLKLLDSLRKESSGLNKGVDALMTKSMNCLQWENEYYIEVDRCMRWFWKKVFDTRPEIQSVRILFPPIFFSLKLFRDLFDTILLSFINSSYFWALV